MTDSDQKYLGLRDMNRSAIGTALLLTAIVASWSVIGIVECLASAALLLTTHFVLAGSKRNVCLGFLGIRIALSWADWFIFDFWISAGLLLCRQLLLVSIGELIVKGLLRSPPQKSDSAPPVRGLLQVGSEWLVVTVIGIGAYLFAVQVEFTGRRVSEPSMYQVIGVGGVAMLALAMFAHFALTMKGISRRSGAVALIYPVVFLVIGAAIVPLQPKPFDLFSILILERAAKNKGDGFNASVNTALECLLRHKDSTVRQCAMRPLYMEMTDELNSAWQEFGVSTKKEDSRFEEDYWRHSFWDGKWPTGPITKRALPILIDLLNNGTRRDRLSAAYAISNAGPKGIPALAGLLDLLHDHGDLANSRVAQDSNSEVGNLLQVHTAMEQLSEEFIDSGKVRKLVAEAIEAIGPAAAEAVPDLTLLLQDILWPVRVSAAEALMQIGPSAGAAIPALEQAANDDTFGDQARVAAAKAICWIDPDHPSGEATLRHVLTQGSIDGQVAVAEALQGMRPHVAGWGVPHDAGWAVDPLLHLLEHENKELRSAAFFSLCSIGSDSARVVEVVEAGVRLAEQEDGGRSYSSEFNRGVWSLFENVTGPGAEALAAVIKNGDREFVTKLLSIIKKNQSLQSAPLVMEAIRTVEQRNQ